MHGTDTVSVADVVAPPESTKIFGAYVPSPAAAATCGVHVNVVVCPPTIDRSPSGVLSVQPPGRVAYTPSVHGQLYVSLSCTVTVTGTSVPGTAVDEPGASVTV